MKNKKTQGLKSSVTRLLNKYNIKGSLKVDEIFKTAQINLLDYEQSVPDSDKFRSEIDNISKKYEYTLFY
jgi:hypothetical protein